MQHTVVILADYTGYRLRRHCVIINHSSLHKQQFSVLITRDVQCMTCCLSVCHRLCMYVCMYVCMSADLLACDNVNCVPNITQQTRQYNHNTAKHNTTTSGTTSCIASAKHHVWTMLAWRSGNALCRINTVALRRARLVLGWVTVYGQVNHLGMEPAS